MGEEKLNPYVVVDRNQNTGIFLVRGRKFVRIVGRDPHFRLMRLPLQKFDEEYRPLTYYSNGAPTAVPYDLSTAARRYLEYGKNTGITEGAQRCLQNIIEGNISMSIVESAQSPEGDNIAAKGNTSVPKMDTLSDALKGVAKKSSTKNGTTPAAKRPSRAVKKGAESTLEPAPSGSSTSTQENDMKSATQASKGSKAHPAVVAKSVKNGKVAGAKKPAAKKAPAAAKKPAAKKAPVTKKTAAKKATPDGRGRAPRIDDNAVITFVADNPKRQGTEAFRKFAQYKKGMRIGDVIKKNVDRADVNYNIARGFVKVKG